VDLQKNDAMQYLGNTQKRMVAKDRIAETYFAKIEGNLV